LAAVMLKKGAQAVALAAEVESLKKMHRKEQAARRAAEEAATAASERATAAETKAAELQEELAAVKGRLFQADTELRIARQNNETLTKRLGLVDRRRHQTIGERLSDDEREMLSEFQREVARVMVQPPAGRPT